MRQRGTASSLFACPHMCVGVGFIFVSLPASASRVSSPTSLSLSLSLSLQREGSLARGKTMLGRLAVHILVLLGASFACAGVPMQERRGSQNASGLCSRCS